MKKKVAMSFSRPFLGDDPLMHIGTKRAVYMRFFDLCLKQNWDAFVVTRKTYLGNGVFQGVWKYENGKFFQIFDKVKIDLVYDRCGGLKFPPENDSLRVINIREFKILANSKWDSYQKLSAFMPKTFWLDDKSQLPEILEKIEAEWVVLKPFNALKGIGIFIGSKEKALEYDFDEKYSQYIVQEFMNTSKGIPNVTESTHDLRVVVINEKVVWSHVRIPPSGEFKANAAVGGTLKEVDYKDVPNSIKEIVEKIAKQFCDEYDNPVFSLDFGLTNSGVPKIYEINDQIGFPTWEMKNRDQFLNGLIENINQKM